MCDEFTKLTDDELLGYVQHNIDAFTFCLRFRRYLLNDRKDLIREYFEKHEILVKSFFSEYSARDVWYLFPILASFEKKMSLQMSQQLLDFVAEARSEKYLEEFLKFADPKIKFSDDQIETLFPWGIDDIVYFVDDETWCRFVQCGMKYGEKVFLVWMIKHRQPTVMDAACMSHSLWIELLAYDVEVALLILRSNQSIRFVANKSESQYVMVGVMKNAHQFSH